MNLALPPTVEFGPCACGGDFEPRSVQIRMTIDDELVVLDDVPQGKCENCGSVVYKAGILEELEAVMRGVPVPPPRALL